jgi:hypothetical protein
MTRKNSGLTAIVLLLIIAGGAVALETTTAQMNDKIQYNTLYDCGDSKFKFKLLSCKGIGKFDRHEIFNINEYLSGGNKGSIYHSQVETNINQGGKINGSAASRSERDEISENDTANSRKNNNQVEMLDDNETGDTVACFASDEDSIGKTVNEKTFRGVIRRLWEKEAKEGSDGAVTITFQKFIIGAPRPWQPTLTDAYSQADPKKPIYPIRVSFETCTDYKTAINKRKMERIYDCFTHKTGGWQCTQTGASGALATKDKKQYIPKTQ